MKSNINDEMCVRKCIDIKNVIKDFVKPHYQAIKFNVSELASFLDRRGLEKSYYMLYEENLQQSLLKYEKEKMPITVDHICFNDGIVFKNNGGTVSLGLNTTKIKSLKAIENSKGFSTLKSLSVYDNYIFNEVTAEDFPTVYGGISEILSDIKSVSTYTIVYVTSNSSIREVTLHDFKDYGNILTTVDLVFDRFDPLLETSVSGKDINDMIIFNNIIS